MKNLIIDSHSHVYPALSESVDRALKSKTTSPKSLIDLIKFIEDKTSIIKTKISPIILKNMSLVHKLSHITRNLPNQYIEFSDRLQSILWSTGLILEGKVDDLKFQMINNSVDYSVIIAHPNSIPNDFIIHLANNDSKYIPIVNIEPQESSQKTFKHYLDLGAKGLKIHAASDGLDAFSRHYLNLLEVANEYRLPVIIHTGCLNISPIYKDPDMGHAEHFESWFKNYPNVKFILAHMNIHYPQVAIDLCKEYENVYTDTSWQPKDSILHAVNEIGANKIMFGTDWPIIGNNISYGLSLIDELLNENKITKKDANQIKGLTAASVFDIQ